MSENTRILVLDGRKILDTGSFYRVLGEVLELPHNFGANLDALWDFLSTDLTGPVTIRWRHSAESEFSMGDLFEKIIDLFDAVQHERDDFHYILE